MLTIKQVAERLGLSMTTVYGWISSGALPHFRLGGKGRRGCIRVAESDLAAFLEAHKCGGWQNAPPPLARRPSPRLKHLALS